jgi:2-(1,2-epoxy-1,2-dihydrophenyl)acetyl-CoA isomerase
MRRPSPSRLRERYNPIITAMWRLDQPIVGAINGVAAGAGASLAFACDIRVAADGASFVLAFGRIGLVPDSGADLVPATARRPAKAAELALLGESLSATDAERFGLVARVVPAETLSERARRWQARLAGPRAARSSPRPSALSSAAGRSISRRRLEDEAYRQGVAGATADHAEASRAFLEKRHPRFSRGVAGHRARVLTSHWATRRLDA